MPKIGDHFVVNLEAMAREKVEEQAKAIDDMVAEAIREATTEGPGIGDFYVSSNMSWDAPQGHPWLDIQNAMRKVEGRPTIIDARFPKDGVYTITEVK